MKKFFLWLNKKLGIYSNQMFMKERIKVLESQLNFLILHSNKHIRRKWKRMLINPKSPFYIFK